MGIEVVLSLCFIPVGLSVVALVISYDTLRQLRNREEIALDSDIEEVGTEESDEASWWENVVEEVAIRERTVFLMGHNTESDGG